MTDSRLLSVSPSPAFWIAAVLYAVATAGLLATLTGHRQRGAIARVVVVAAFVAHGLDIAWRGALHVHPAQSVREALGLLSWVVTGGYLIARTRYPLTLGGALVMPVSLVLLALARLSRHRPRAIVRDTGHAGA